MDYERMVKFQSMTKNNNKKLQVYLEIMNILADNLWTLNAQTFASE